MFRTGGKILEGWYDQLLESPLHRTNHGIPYWLGRLRTVGNAVVPDVAEIFAREIKFFLMYKRENTS